MKPLSISTNAILHTADISISFIFKGKYGTISLYISYVYNGVLRTLHQVASSHALLCGFITDYYIWGNLQCCSCDPDHRAFKNDEGYSTLYDTSCQPWFEPSY
jgi:hypothetical protein